jgi:hypothetical protein
MKRHSPQIRGDILRPIKQTGGQHIAASSLAST